MKVFFDEDVPRKLARSLSQHDIQTVVKYQQQLEGRPFAVLIMSAINWPVIRPHIQKISAALDQAQPGTVKKIDCGVFIARSKPASE